VLMSFPRPTVKAAVIITVIVLAPVLFVSRIAHAAGEWHVIGATANGDEVLVSSISAQKNGLRTAWIRVQYKEAAKLPQGGPFIELRARVRFNCAKGTATPNSEWFYSLDKGGKLVVSKKMRRDDQFGSTAEGGFGAIARDFVCQQK
jgi:hypothetical protein